LIKKPSADDKAAKKQMINLAPINKLLLHLERYLNKKALPIKKRAPNTIIAILVQMETSFFFFVIQFLRGIYARLYARPPLNPRNTPLYSLKPGIDSTRITTIGHIVNDNKKKEGLMS
jgi:hypothetical protein